VKLPYLNYTLLILGIHYTSTRRFLLHWVLFTNTCSPIATPFILYVMVVCKLEGVIVKYCVHHCINSLLGDVNVTTSFLLIVNNTENVVRFKLRQIFNEFTGHIFSYLTSSLLKWSFRCKQRTSKIELLYPLWSVTFCFQKLISVIMCAFNSNVFIDLDFCS
jgi:hypothetical protein